MITKRQVENSPYSVTEELARVMYDEYCKEVGGTAYDGRPLPTSEEFFNDDSKIRQHRGWLKAASTAIELILGK